MFIRRTLALLASAFLVSFGFSTAAFAHAELVGAMPAADEVVSTWPTQVVLTFNEDLLTTGEQPVNFLTVADSAGTQIDLLDSTVSGSSISVSLLGDTAPGAYFVNYRVISADGHVVEDSYEFVFDASELAEAVPINETEGEPVATPYTVEEESSSNLGLMLGLVTLGSFILLVSQFRKNRYK